MSTEFFVPKLGQTVEQVTLVNWLVPDGAKVSVGQELMEVETDKAVFPVEANAKGYLHIGPYHKGDVVPVLTVVAIIGAQDEIYKVSNTQADPAEAPSKTESPAPAVFTAVGGGSPMQTGRVFASPRARKLASLEEVNLGEVAPSGEGGDRIVERDVIAYLARQSSSAEQPLVTPLARKVAQVEGIDLSSVSGSGPGGKIGKEDIRRALQERQRDATESTLEAGVMERLPLTGVRGVIAGRMSTSARTTARVTLLMDVDAGELVSLRQRLMERVEQSWGFAPGYTDLLAKITAAALRKYPYMNARLADEHIEMLANINIGLAVDTERGLLVPVVRDVDRKSLRQFGEEFRDLVGKVRIGRALPDDLSGGTFTITNLGMYEVDAFTPVINLPEAAILGVGRILPKPVVREGAVVVRPMLTLSLAFDHRLVDGAPAARFLQYLKQLIEEPYLLLAE
jgi:pyruvate dehydrogenase E2 component (dihydrolipoamide acetyltransferase)